MKRTFIKKSIFTLLAAILSVANSFGQTAITTGALSPTEVCAGGNVTVNFTLTGTALATTTFSAQLSDATGAFTTPTEIGSSATATPITATIPLGTTPGAAYKIRVVSVPVTPPAIIGSESAALKVNAIPGKPTVTTPVAYEVGDKPVALAATGTGLKWYDAETGGTGSATIPVPTTTAEGTQNFFVSQTVGGCESARSEIVVNVTKTVCTPPAKPTVSNESYTLNADADPLSATPSTGLLWYTAATGGTGSPTAPTPSTNTVGTKSYYVSRTVSGCESERAEIVVTVTACVPPKAPDAANVSYCINEATNTLTATGTALKWYNAASGGSPLGAAPKPSSASVGNTSYYVSQTVGGCESPRAEIKVTITQTAPPTVENLDYCLNATAPTLTATGSNLKWYAASSGGTGSAAAPTPTTTAIGTKSYFVSQTIGDCESARSEIKVTIKNVSPLPTVTSPINLCQNTDAIPLKATGTALQWYTAATGGNGSSTAPSPNTATVGTTSYYVSQTASGLCEGPRAKIDVIIKDTPAAPTVSTPIEYCVGETAKVLTPAGPTFKWYSAPNDVTGNTSPPTPKTTTAGTTTYYVTQSSTYGSLVCESSRADVNVVVNARPAALPTVSEAFCQERADKTYTLTAQPASGNTVNWYTTPTGGTASKTAPSVNLKNAGETTFYATQVLGKCESTARVAQKIRVKPLPALPGIEKPLIEICQFVAAQPLTATPVTNGILKWYGTNATGGDPSDAAPIPSTAEGGTTSYFVGQALEGCFGDRAKIDVKINTTPKPQTTTRLAYCQNEVAPRLDATGSILKWYRNASDTEFQGVPFTPFTEKVQDYSFFVTQTGTNGCESPKEEIKIHIKALPSATISGSSTIDLGQTATIRIRFTGDGPWVYTLSDGTTDTTDQQNHEIQVKPTTTTSYLLTDVTNSCGKGFPIGSALVTVKIPTINSGNPSVAEACAGKTFNVPFQQSGDFPAENTFKVQIATENTDAKFKSIPSVASSNLITATFPDTTLGGSYYVRVVSSGTNPEFTVKGSVSSITITASPLPVATITGTQTILVGDKADMKIETTGKAPWTFTLSNGTKDSLITASVTPYTFKLAPRVTTIYTISKVTNGCGTGKGAGSARVQVDPILGVEPPASADWVKVYPTLVTSQCTVELTGTVSPKEARAEVIDLTGRSRAVKTINQKTTEVDFSSYPSGLYLLRVTNGNKNTVWRIMKP
ncbi:T9SS type A sorting domain-containing protein [Dyadobacter sp. CY107]|uniref:Ig-like domain-containing protein n=1 Tax=Dyadobacter fanqingshengii TaxID=2906443 RepID=UPI001F4603CE|nr:T9SS type A sorting domain-containing protein [Dyadobacter fanqingshengii]MCF2503757.1 T9SS type A sorting domain-containing protein [Dyadobacter fanqingshengii]